MKTLISILAVMAMGAAGAHGGIVIQFSQPDQTASPGQTLQFFGYLSNVDADAGGRIYLNADSLNLELGLASYSFTDLFFSTVPLFLDSGESTAELELFNVTLDPFPADPFGTYWGTYGLLGGFDGGDGSAQDHLAQATFSVKTIPPNVPEPSSLVMVATGFALLYVGTGKARTHPQH